MKLKVAYIMRGVPGSGKSTVARQLANGATQAIHSTDNYFYSGGEYLFDRQRLSEYHDRNYEAFCHSLDTAEPVVICDNTNVRRWEFERYEEAANKAGYLVALVVMPLPVASVAAQRTLHGVPAHIIQRMIDSWEN